MILKNKISFDIITIFPHIFDSYFKESIIKRAQEQKRISINIYDLRNYTKDKHKTVDDKPYGGGPGMALMIEPVFKAVENLKNKKKVRKRKQKVILFSANGKKFDQKMANKFSKLDQLIMICGRYEGVDERIAKHIADEEISIGDYILTGGEIPTMVVVDAVSRLIPGVLGKQESLEEKKGSYPVYTRPETFKDWKVPEVLLSGNHKKIKEWRKKHSRS